MRVPTGRRGVPDGKTCRAEAAYKRAWRAVPREDGKHRIWCGAHCHLPLSLHCVVSPFCIFPPAYFLTRRKKKQTTSCRLPV